MIICKQYSKVKHTKTGAMIAQYDMKVVLLFGLIPLYIRKIKVY